MIKKITFLMLAALTLTVSASADDNLTFNWAHSVDGETTAGDNVNGVYKAADGNYFAVTTFGTTSSALNVKVDGETLTDASGNAIEGSHYTGTSNNANLLLQKVDAQTGSIAWFVYTKKGDVDNSYTPVAATADGGVVIAVKCRAWVEADGLDNLLEVVDAQGNTTTVKDMGTVSGEYRYLIVKLNADGKLEWTRLIAGLLVNKGEKIDESYTSALKSATKNNLYVYGMDVDEEGNIYLCGNFRTKMSLKDKEGKVVTLVAKNNSSWTGDSQTVMGDLFLLKLTNEGYIDKSLTAEGTASCAFFDNVVYNNGNLYLNGRVKGDGTEMTVGGKAVNASADFQTMIVASVKASDLTVNYLKTFTSVANKSNKFVLQNKNAQFVGGSVYFTGLINGGWAKEGSTEAFLNTGATQLKGYVLKLDPETGDVQNSYVKTDGGIGGFFGVYVGTNNTYAFGYDMGSGAILSKISNSTYTANDTTICTFGTVALLGKPLIDGDNFVMINRGKSTATFAGTDKSFKCTNWGLVYYSYKINDEVSSVSNIAANKGVGNYDVYTVGGVLLKKADTYEAAVKGLAKGIYIIGGQKVTVE